MSIAYYAIQEPGKDWREIEQVKIEYKEWRLLGDEMMEKSRIYNAHIRVCETPGVENQSFYFVNLPSYTEAKPGEIFNGNIYVILPMTFKKHGVQEADLYLDESNLRIDAVGKGECGPINTIKVATIQVNVNRCYYCVCREKKQGTTEEQNHKCI